MRLQPEAKPFGLPKRHISARRDAQHRFAIGPGEAGSGASGLRGGGGAGLLRRKRAPLDHRSVLGPG